MSTEGIIEIATWTASEGYKADPSLIHPALEIVKPTKGVLGYVYFLRRSWLVSSMLTFHRGDIASGTDFRRKTKPQSISSSVSTHLIRSILRSL